MGSKFTPEAWLERVKGDLLPRCRDWMDNPPHGKSSFLILSGPVGTGKTSAALSLGMHRTRWADVVNDWAISQWSPSVHAYGCGMLDDVRDCGSGKFAKQPGDIFEQIIDEVEANPALRLIITTNLTGEELRGFAGERAFDRLKGSGVSIPFNGVSLRGAGLDGQDPPKRPRMAAGPRTTAERMHEITYQVAEVGGPARQITARMAAQKAQAGECPFDGDPLEWPEWKRAWVAEGQAVIDSGGPRVNRAMGRAFMQALQNFSGGTNRPARSA